MGLVIALGITVVMSISVTTSVYYTSTNSRSTTRSSADQKALSLAEAGMNNAVSVLNKPSNNALSQNIMTATCCTSSQSYDGNTSYWWGVLSGNTWTVYGKGVVTNPGSSDVIRQVSAKVVVLTNQTQAYNAQAWDYIMSTATGSVCDQTIANGSNTGNPAIVNARLYVFGNLCIGTSEGGLGQITGAPLEVRGKININSGGSSIGSSSTPIAGAHIGGGCSLLGGPLTSPCTSAQQVWSNPLADTAFNTAIAAPVADFTGWYTNAKPGPANPCSVTSGTPPVWDNDATKNNSAATVNLTPSSSYTCQIANYGELSWNASTKVLTVSGTIYIDGSASITNGALNQYVGQATLYLSGTFYMSDSSKLCGLVSGSTCDWAGWNPNTRLFGIVAQGSGGQNPAGVGIWMYNAHFQGALYASAKVRPEGTTQTQGPMIGSEIELGYNVSTSAFVANGFPIITVIPSGFPGITNVYAAPQPPTTFSG